MNLGSLPKAVRALIAGGAGCIAIATCFIGGKEGQVLTAYQDARGNWTICDGHTQGVKKGDTANPAECQAYLQQDVAAANKQLDSLIHVPMTPSERAAAISFCTYNLGYGKCAQSSFIKDLNNGQRAKACAVIKQYIYDGGKDCRVRANDCYGQVLRREQESQLCLS
jgi:lysozyme